MAEEETAAVAVFFLARYLVKSFFLLAPTLVIYTFSNQIYTFTMIACAILWCIFFHFLFMKHWLVTVEYMLPYPRKHTFRVEASHQFRAPAAALAAFKALPEIKRKKLCDLRMTFRVEPMGIIA